MNEGDTILAMPVKRGTNHIREMDFYLNRLTLFNVTELYRNFNMIALSDQESSHEDGVARNICWQWDLDAIVVIQPHSKLGRLLI